MEPLGGIGRGGDQEAPRLAPARCRISAVLTSPKSRLANSSLFPEDIRWIRSYVVAEDDGSLGTVCIYEASSQEAVRRHAAQVEMPADEVVPIADTVVVRPDPAAAAAASAMADR